MTKRSQARTRGLQEPRGLGGKEPGRHAPASDAPMAMVHEDEDELGGPHQ